MKKQYKPSEICKFFRVSKVTLINWINSGKLPAYETLGGHYRIMHDDLINFINERKLLLPDELKSDEEQKPQKKRIMIVDDEPNVIESIKLILNGMGADVEIESAREGFEAGIKIAQFIPHLLILDASMPNGFDGSYVVKMIRSNSTLKNIKILVFTGYRDKGLELIKLGADKFIEKGSKEVDSFKTEVCRLLGIKYRKVVLNASREILKRSK